MSARSFSWASQLPVSAASAYAWHLRPGAFQRLTPPWEPVHLLSPEVSVAEGSRAALKVGHGPLALRWVAEHRNLETGRQFEDVQVEGPFRSWRHRHRVDPSGPSACRLEDSIDWELPLSRLSHPLAGWLVERKLERMFRYRHDVTRLDLERHARYGGETMRVLVSGSSGLVGSALMPYLSTGGHEARALARDGGGSNEPWWDPERGLAGHAGFEGYDAVVHLAGESIVGRWTPAKKERIRSSRVRGTRLLAQTLARLERKPRVLVSASAIGFYGDRGFESLDESSCHGEGFLAEVCEQWERACDPAREAGIRVVNLRIGVVLSSDGGALAQMLTPFKLGVGGRIGDGRQYMSWIAMDDLLGAIHHCLVTPSLVGPANAVSPTPISNETFTRTLGRVLRRPTMLPMPGLAARLAFGEMAEELLLASTRVQPNRLLATGYEFAWPELEPALRHMLGVASTRQEAA